MGCVHGLGQHLAGAAQHGVTGRMAMVVVDGLEAVEVDGEHAQRPGTLAADAVELFHVEGPVAQLREHVVLAQILEIGLGLLARGDVHQREQHQRPIILVPLHDGELHVDVHRLARQRVVDDLALLEQLAVPQVLQLLGKGLMHLATEYAADLVEQLGLAVRAEHVQRLLVHVDDTDLLHAAVHEFGVYLDEGLEVADTLAPHIVHEALDGAEILHPQRDRRMLEQAARIALAALELCLGLHLGRDILQRDQHPAPRGLMPGQHAHADEDVEPSPVQGVVHGLVGILQRTGPQRLELVAHLQQHVVAKDLVQAAHQFFLAGGGKQVQGALVDAQHLQAGHALAQLLRVLREMGTQVAHPRRTPAVEQAPHLAEILQPERHRCQREHVFEIQIRRNRSIHMHMPYPPCSAIVRWKKAPWRCWRKKGLTGRPFPAVPLPLLDQGRALRLRGS